MKTCPRVALVSVSLAILIPAGLAGCEIVEVGDVPPPVSVPSSAMMFGQLDSATVNKAYREDLFAKINGKAYPTDLSDTDRINVFVNEAAASAYATILPQKTGTQVDLPEGSIIIREVLQDGKLTKLTAMIKGPPGYFPQGGNYFYAVTSVDGREILSDEDGNELAGPIPVCGGCHAGRASDGFLFGVAESAQKGDEDDDEDERGYH